MLAKVSYLILQLSLHCAYPVWPLKPIDKNFWIIENSLRKYDNTYDRIKFETNYFDKSKVLIYFYKRSTECARDRDPYEIKNAGRESQKHPRNHKSMPWNTNTRRKWAQVLNFL